MLSKEDFIVLKHYLQEGIPKTVIARKLGISRMTVYRHVSSKVEPAYNPRPHKPSVLDLYRDYIKGRLELYPELTAVRLFTEIKAIGYAGKYTTVKDYVRRIRPKAPVEIEQRFEVSPGQQAQVDFATFKTPFGTVQALLVVLSWSRYLWVRFFLHQDQLTVLGGLHRAFLSFGGVPRSLLFDRMKTAVVKSGDNGKAIFNDEMLRFAMHCNFRPLACRPYRARTKGRVERAVSYLRQGFFYVRRFRDLEDLNRQLDQWLKYTANTRIHGTTEEIPAERLEQERPRLSPLPSEAYVPVINLGRKISRDGYISYNGNDYSVREGFTKSEVTVAATLEEVRFYQDNKLVASHLILEGKGQRHLGPNHQRSGKVNSREKQETAMTAGDLIEVQRRPLEVYEEVLR